MAVMVTVTAAAMEELEWHEADEEISKSIKNELVCALRVKSKVAKKKLVQHIPIGLHIHELGTPPPPSPAWIAGSSSKGPTSMSAPPRYH